MLDVFSEHKVVIGNLLSLHTNNPVSYTHLTLPTTLVV